MTPTTHAILDLINICLTVGIIVATFESWIMLVDLYRHKKRGKGS